MNLNLNQDQAFGVLRVVVPPILAYAAGKGWLTSSQAAGIVANLPDIAAFIVTIGGGVWSFLRHSDTGKVAAVATMSPELVNAATQALPPQAKIAIAAALPEVQKIVTTPEVAKAAPSVKVVDGAP